MKTTDWQRRRFLRLGSGTLAGAGLALGANPLATLAQASDGLLDDGDDYRALVCVYLEGGCDGFSLLVPTGTAEHAAYARSRGTLALDRGRLLMLSQQGAASVGGSNGSEQAVGLHPSARELEPLFDEGRLAMIANVGNLVQPTTREQYEARSVALPAQLFSHADQAIQWQQLQGRNRGTEGWGARAATELSREHAQRNHLTSISMAGSNHWQSSKGQRPYAMKDTGVIGYNGLDASSGWQKPRHEAFHRVLEHERHNLFADAYADLQKRASQITGELGEVLERESDRVPSAPSENPLAASLGMVARMVAARSSLGMQRQIFYVRMNGFDVHDNQNKEMPELFAALGEALAYFQNALDGLGESANVTTFTASDFGRSLNSNGDGTDHGWGNHLMAMGGAVSGGRVIGQMPVLDVDGPDSVQNGRILPTLAAPQYAATLLRWIGLDDEQLRDVLPTLANFSEHDLGFMT